MIKVEVQGLSEILEVLTRPFKFSGILGKLVKRLADYSRGITHVETGAWRSAHSESVFDDYGEVYIDPAATNPKRGTPVMVYASIWESRGGDLAVYERTAGEIGDDILGDFEAKVAETIFD